ncbi:protein ABHD11-like isoform X2 [Cylas formicarius]|uniref:protein ABHD11-like isoform X2 n=1 Tax=Cylas formicarius TaxID=197179 RepID=UPI002958803C|nr:protein ABHD11-like isoform X2 [Cylas formicarius]
MFKQSFNLGLSFLGLKTVNKQYSNAETLAPIKLAFATYEKSLNDDKHVPPFLILHGLFGSKSNWVSLCKAYQQRTLPQRKVIALDLRNHGDSPHSESHSYADLAADVKQFLVDQHIHKVDLMGHSMGGRTAMLFALKYPEHVNKLIIVDISPVTTSPNLNQMPGLFTAMERVQLPKNVSMSKARSTVDAQLAKSIADPNLRAFLLTNLVQKDDGYRWRVNIPALLQNFNNITRFPLLNDMQYKGSTLFIGGANSDFIGRN